MRKKSSVYKTIIIGDNAYGATRKKLWSNGQISEIMPSELWQVSYFPTWAEKYPMWLNKILFWFFNHNMLRRLEKYL